MKRFALLCMLMVAALLVGCEDKKLTTCQEEKADLQSQLTAANAAIAKHEAKIETMKVENTEMQTKALDSIRTMMEKEKAAKEKTLQQLTAEKAAAKKAQEQLSAEQATVKTLQGKVAELEAALKAAQEAAAAKPAADAAESM